MDDKCPYSGNCEGNPFRCNRCKNNPKNKGFPTPWIVPFRDRYPNTTPSPNWRQPKWEFICVAR